jgi:hypothetical protein
VLEMVLGHKILRSEASNESSDKRSIYTTREHRSERSIATWRPSAAPLARAAMRQRPWGTYILLVGCTARVPVQDDTYIVARTVARGRRRPFRWQPHVPQPKRPCRHRSVKCPPGLALLANPDERVLRIFHRCPACVRAFVPDYLAAGDRTRKGWRRRTQREAAGALRATELEAHGADLQGLANAPHLIRKVRHSPVCSFEPTETTRCTTFVRSRSIWTYYLMEAGATL